MNLHQQKAMQKITAHMANLNNHQNAIFQLQSVWDNLSLLAQLSGTGIDISQTRKDFGKVTQSVMDNLALEMLNKSICSLSSKAYVIINLVVRNLFERTADIGFLSTDDEIRQYLIKQKQGEANNIDHESLRLRFSEYVKKYSVYHNILLLAPDGKLLVQLDQTNPVEHSNDPLIQEALTSEAPYLETYRQTDLLPRLNDNLIYTYRVTHPDTHEPIGVLCLCFKFQDEMKAVFKNLIPSDDWAVGVMLDKDKKVIASSDAYQVPIGAELETSDNGNDWLLTRFAGREYLAVTCHDADFQGYTGPQGCMGHALIPVEHAFDTEHLNALKDIDEELLNKVMRSPLIFSHSLLDIPKNAAVIQSKLNQSVWNGNIWQNNAEANDQNNFSKTLLWEISNTGLKTQQIIKKTVNELYQTVVSIMLDNSKFQAYLAADIMDRNLYERANDCRWWALTGAFREILTKTTHTKKDINKLEEILIYINELYTVYENLVLFDRQGKIIAVSNIAYKGQVGDHLKGDWVARTRSIPSTQEYVVSDFEKSPLYNGEYTYIYAAAIRSPDNIGIVGGIGIVFDSTSQFKSILEDVSPRDHHGELIPGSFTAFVDGNLRIVSSTRPDAVVGDQFNIHPGLCNIEIGNNIFDIALYQDRYYAVGAYGSSGYREYKSVKDTYQNKITAMIFIPLGDADEIDALIADDNASLHNEFKTNTSNNLHETVEYATFYIGKDWLGLPSSCVLEALEPEKIRQVPDSDSALEGLINYKEDVIPIFNLPRVFNKTDEVSAKHQQVIVLAETQTSPKFGIIVTALGEIPSINPDAIEPNDNIFGSNSQSIASGITSMMSAEQKKLMLTIVATDKIWHMLNKQPTLAGGTLESTENEVVTA